MSDKKYPRLRGRIIENYGSYRNFAETWGKSMVAVSNKLNQKTGFSQSDIVEWSTLLDINLKDIGSFFFDKKLNGD